MRDIVEAERRGDRNSNLRISLLAGGFKTAEWLEPNPIPNGFRNINQGVQQLSDRGEGRSISISAPS